MINQITDVKELDQVSSGFSFGGFDFGSFSLPAGEGVVTASDSVTDGGATASGSASGTDSASVNVSANGSGNGGSAPAFDFSSFFKGFSF